MFGIFTEDGWFCEKVVVSVSAAEAYIAAELAEYAAKGVEVSAESYSIKPVSCVGYEPWASYEASASL